MARDRLAEVGVLTCLQADGSGGSAGEGADGAKGKRRRHERGTRMEAMSQGPDRQPLDSRADFAAAARWVVAHAAASGMREMQWVDPDFQEWPLDDRDLLSRATLWVRAPQRKLLLVAHDYGQVPRRHPRFVEWRRTWSHRLQCRGVSEIDPSQVPTLLLAGEVGLQVLDRTRWRGRWLTDANDLKAWREVIEALLQRSEDAFGANTLGL